ncbi:MAG: hypothetical protein LRZ85_09740 [Alphaproteobacteria bacterium]|nr:hypothetical protein [Alphaproteobacteria bacterium]MCD8570870.1 hypothetical protein [Alphaproteobacteria bacterium]
MALRLFLTVLCLTFSAGFVLADEVEAHKQELAQEMHKLRPTKAQVQAAIAVVAQRVPEDKRMDFESALNNVLDHRAIEKISIDAMVETFTEEELEAMVEYYSKPEARSAADKLPEYQGKVGPEIIHMIDKAMMKLRTGE